LASLFLVSLALPGAATAREANIDPKAVPKETNPALLLKLAGDLSTWGSRAADPLALIVSARLLAQVPTEPIERTKIAEGGAASDKSGSRQLDLRTVIENARELSGDDEDLLAMIADVEGEARRGVVDGPAAHTDRIEANATDVFNNVEFEGGKEAAVYLQGDGDTDLDLLIQDQFGIEICRRDSYADRELCRWTPRWTGPFSIIVKNHGSVWNHYRLVTN
jgi:hypothetical protein